MPELKKVEIETESNPPAPAAPSDRVIDLAVEVGQMRAEGQATRGEIAQVRSELSRACDLIQSQSEMLQSLQSQTSRTEERAEVAQATAAAALEEATEEGENGGVLDVTPQTETHIEIDQRPAGTKRSLISRLIFGGH